MSRPARWRCARPGPREISPWPGNTSSWCGFTTGCGRRTTRDGSTGSSGTASPMRLAACCRWCRPITAPWLAFEEARWRRKKDDYDGAAQLLLAHDDTPIRPDLWWGERLMVARRLLAGGNSDIAYRLVQHPNSADGF